MKTRRLLVICLLSTWIHALAAAAQTPAAPASVVVKKLLGIPGYAPLEKRGAFPCIGILTREEITNEMRDLAVRYEATR